MNIHDRVTRRVEEHLGRLQADTQDPCSSVVVMDDDTIPDCVLRVGDDWASAVVDPHALLAALRDLPSGGSSGDIRWRRGSVWGAITSASAEVHEFRGRGYSARRCDGCLVVMLSSHAAEAWGAYLERGVDTRDCGEFRNLIRHELARLGREAKVEIINVCATIDGEAWQVDEIDASP